MGYSTPNIAFDRQRNLSGGIAQEPGTLTITGPVSIEGSAVTATWTLKGTIADTFRVTLGTTPIDTQLADSGDIPAGSGEDHSYTFRDLTYTTTIAFLTVKYKFGKAPYQGIQRKLPINIELTPVDETPSNNWDDSTLWDDSTAWSE